MIWFLLILLLVFLGPAILFGLGLLALTGFLVIAVPLATLLGVWIAVIWLIVLIFPGAMLLGVIIGLAAGVAAARIIRKAAASNASPSERPRN